MNSSAVTSLTFFFPYREVSGVPVLFLRMAEYISENYGIETCIVDYPDGYMSRTLRKDSCVRIAHFHDGVTIEVGPDTILVMQSILPNTMRPELKIHRDTRIVFWTLYPLNLIPTIIPLTWARHIQAKYIGINRLIMDTIMISLRNDLRDLVNSFVEGKAIFFMDGTTLKNTTERLGVTIDNPIYMPVPCDFISENRKRTRRALKDGNISVCWVGRLADFKIHILIYAIMKLSEYAAKKKRLVRMHIIGEGPDSNMLKRKTIEHTFFHVVKAGVVTGEALDEYLLDQVDLLMAMGTSALEGAKLGVPTILLDASYGPVKEGYKFRWLFESKNYGLADMINVDNFEKNNHSLDRAIDALINDYSRLSDKTYDYCVRNHSIVSVTETFIGALTVASFRYRDINPDVLKKSLIRKSYEYIRKMYYAWNWQKD